MSTSSPRLPRLIGEPEVKVLRLHGLEKALLAVVILQLTFLPWAVGGMKFWTQCIALGLSVLAFILALIPRRYREEHTGGETFTLHPLPRLLRFPVFWLGLLMAAYIAIGALNPGWRYVLEGTKWWMVRMPHVTWLPHGVTDVPILWGSPWRSLLIFATAHLLVCALWIGVTRRRSVEVLLLAFTLNALLLALFALVGRATGMTKLYWTWPSPNDPFGPFVYRNHAAAWLNLAVGIAAALAAIVHQKASRRMAKSSPAPLLAFVAVLISVAVVLSWSRGGVLSLCCFVAPLLLVTAWYQFRRENSSRLTAVSALLVAGFIGFAALSLNNSAGAKVWQRFASFVEDRDSSREARDQATSATMDMWRGAPWWGSGGGSFRYVFPLYQQHYPLIYEIKIGRKIRRYTWEYAHNDWAQMLAEYGVIGSAVAGAAIAWWLLLFARLRAWTQPAPMVLALCLAAALVHARGEFIFRCPAVLFLACALAILALRSAELAPRSIRSTGGRPAR